MDTACEVNRTTLPLLPGAGASVKCFPMLVVALKRHYRQGIHVGFLDLRESGDGVKG